MMKVSVVAVLALLAVAPVPISGTAGVVYNIAGYKECTEQSVFDVFMCNSKTCTECDLKWCLESCTDIQKQYPACACAAWTDAKSTYSAQDIAVNTRRSLATEIAGR